ncbi:MAG TPA: hypothetical protein ENI48_04630, partial [Thioploca sp.]|nr:hypothetical protein [Thioploca sp.]
MPKSPLQFNHQHLDEAYPADNLSQYSWHTGAPLRPLQADETLSALFRDIGPVAMTTFLDRGLKRLAGPVTPITYMRTAAYQEPYTDYERIGRLVFLQPRQLHPWCSGVSHIYVAQASRLPDVQTIAFVPGTLSLEEADPLSRDVRNRHEWREVLGGRPYDDIYADTLERLNRLNQELQDSEKLALPLRRALQSSIRDIRLRARDTMRQVGLTESDLCTAWHHIAPQRRAMIWEALKQIEKNCKDSLKATTTRIRYNNGLKNRNYKDSLKATTTRIRYNNGLKNRNYKDSLKATTTR